MGSLIAMLTRSTVTLLALTTIMCYKIKSRILENNNRRIWQNNTFLTWFILGLVNKLSSILDCRQTSFGWLRPQQNSDYQPVGLRFASLPALSSLEPKRNLISLPVLTDKKIPALTLLVRLTPLEESSLSKGLTRNPKAPPLLFYNKIDGQEGASD